MPDYQKDTPRQAALRREIETHAIWQYPPEERLQHNREWQSLYLLVFEFKNFLQKIEHRLQNTDATITPTIAAAAAARITNGRILVGSFVCTAFTELLLSSSLFCASSEAVSEDCSIFSVGVTAVLKSVSEEISVDVSSAESAEESVLSSAAGVSCVSVTTPVSYPSSSISSPTKVLLPAIPNGLKECVLNTMVLPSTLGTIVSMAPLSRRCSIV